MPSPQPRTWLRQVFPSAKPMRSSLTRCRSALLAAANCRTSRSRSSTSSARPWALTSPSSSSLKPWWAAMMFLAALRRSACSRPSATPARSWPPCRRRMLRTRNAILPDVERIHAIMQPYAEKGTLLPRTMAELSENVRDFVVAENDGVVIGCGALHLYGLHLAEIRSIAVVPEAKGLGAGRKLVEALLQESERHHTTCVCLFPRIPGLFPHICFTVPNLQKRPHTIHNNYLH